MTAALGLSRALRLCLYMGTKSRNKKRGKRHGEEIRGISRFFVFQTPNVVSGLSRLSPE